MRNGSLSCASLCSSFGTGACSVPLAEARLRRRCNQQAQREDHAVERSQIFVFDPFPIFAADLEGCRVACPLV
eukprot:6410572-Amphidinium_carterae.1